MAASTRIFARFRYKVVNQVLLIHCTLLSGIPSIQHRLERSISCRVLVNNLNVSGSGVKEELTCQAWPTVPHE